MSFKYNFEVHAEDIDDMGHVNNVVYLRYVQRIAESHWKSLANSDLREKVLWVVLRHEIDYKKPAFVRDQLVGETWVEPASGPKMPRHVVIRNDNNEVLIEAKTIWCALDADTMRPMRITTKLESYFQ